MIKSYWEKAKNNLSICKSCGRNIKKGVLKLIIMDTFRGSPVKKSYHKSCGRINIIREISRLEKLINSLSRKDKIELRGMLK